MTSRSILPHADHDQLAVAASAAGDAEGAELERARRLVGDCPECAELFADLRAIQSATTALPPPRRTRDFRLTEADAARLRPRGWRSILAAFGGPRLALTQPLAVGMATLGLVGLLVASLPGPLLTGTSPASDGGAAVEMAPEAPAAGTTEDMLKTEATGPAASAAPANAEMPEPAPGETPGTALVPAPSPADGSAAERSDAQVNLGFDEGSRDVSDSGQVPWLPALSALLLVAGVLLLALGRAARWAR